MNALGTPRKMTGHGAPPKMFDHAAPRKRPSRRAVGLAFHFCIVLLVCCRLLPSAYAQTATRPASDGDAPAHPLHRHKLLAGSEVVTIAIPDITMTDQDDRKVRLYEELMKGRLVVLNFFYTTCGGVCPTSGSWLAGLQHRLGARLGKEVVSLDPKVDTPARLRRWSLPWKPKPGWTLLTSEGEDARALVDKFLAGQPTGMHSPVVFVGDGSRNPVGWVAVDIIDESRALLDYFDKAKGR